MSVTADVFQVPIGWLKNWAPLNMLRMLVTADVSQVPMGWLKDLQRQNM